MREQRESTGLGFSFLMKSVEVHGPVMVENECVDDLAQRSPANAPNDVEYMVDEYIRHGYRASSCAVDSADYAGFVRRIRQWWAAVMVAQGVPHSEVTAWFTTLLSHFKLVDQDIFSLSEVMVPDSSAWADAAVALGVPLFKDFGPRTSQTKKEDLEWKVDHLKVFTANNMEWPLNHDEIDPPSLILRDGLFVREQELAALLDILWPPTLEDADYVFCDVNPKLHRVLGCYLEDRIGKPKGRQSPWQSRCRTQVGSGKLIVRHSLSLEDRQECGKTTLVRLVEAFEALRMIGYSDTFWGDVSEVSFASDKYLFMLTNIAGNSYPLFHYIPWHCSLVSTYGRFMEDPDVKMSFCTDTKGDDDMDFEHGGESEEPDPD